MNAPLAAAPTVLVAGIGNIFFGDDAFGVEVARRLQQRRWPAGVEVVDVGIRAVHLAFRMLDGVGALVLVDALPHGAEPGTITVLEPSLTPAAVASATSGDVGAPFIDPHGLDPVGVLSTIDALGASAGRTLVVGCEPADVGEGIGLSPAVASAVDTAVAVVERLVREELARCGADRSEPSEKRSDP